MRECHFCSVLGWSGDFVIYSTNYNSSQSKLIYLNQYISIIINTFPILTKINQTHNQITKIKKKKKNSQHTYVGIITILIMWVFLSSANTSFANKKSKFESSLHKIEINLIIISNHIKVYNKIEIHKLFLLHCLQVQAQTKSHPRPRDLAVTQGTSIIDRHKEV